MRKKNLRKATFDQFKAAMHAKPEYKGQWHEIVHLPILLELGCGKAELGLGLAQLHADQFIVGIDAKIDRLWVAAQNAELAGIENISFFRADIGKLNDYFADGEINEIWITFPDPFPKNSHARRRLTAADFLKSYRHLLQPGGLVHLKTDNADLMAFTLEVLEGFPHQKLAFTDNLHYSEFLTPETSLLTT